MQVNEKGPPGNRQASGNGSGAGSIWDAAELVQVPTRVIDRVIHWAQEQLGKEYLQAGRVQGRDLKETRAPQRFGLRLSDVATRIEK